MADCLFELGCEELPSASVWPLAESLVTKITSELNKVQLNFSTIKPFATPRRIAFIISELQNEQPSQRLMRRGPAVSVAYDEQGKPTPAALGFAKSCGVPVTALTTEKTEKGEWLFYEVVTAGRKSEVLLPQMLQKALMSLPITKAMRWSEGDIEFARPVHWAVLMFDKEVVSCDVLGVKTGKHTYGHRFHHPQAVELQEPRTYEKQLQNAFVMVDFAKRRESIKNQVEQLAQLHQGNALIPANLLDEVTSIVEWPQALIGNFSPAFLVVPPEALIAAMQQHQKCFCIHDSSGTLRPQFITIANIVSSNPERIIAGNEKVMNARLSDADFFFRQDKKSPLSDHIAATAGVIFQAKLGSLYDKSERLQHLMAYLSPLLHLEETKAKRAAELSKCDLLTGMVGEFPELQGKMGFYYGLHDGESEDVACALEEQYRPRFATDTLPDSPLGLALSLVDRIDTLVGIFAIGQKPSGEKDPYKLRRHALAIVRILTRTPEPVELSQLLTSVKNVYGNRLPYSSEGLVELKAFILERLHSFFFSQGYSNELIQAVRARQDDWLYDFAKRIEALAEFVRLPEAANLAIICKRVTNLLQHASFLPDTQAINQALLTQKEEKALWDHILASEEILAPLYLKKDYTKLLKELARLHTPVNNFFDQVMVMVDSVAIKNNRLNLLARLQNILQQVADISHLSNL